MTCRRAEDPATPRVSGRRRGFARSVNANLHACSRTRQWKTSRGFYEDLAAGTRLIIANKGPGSSCRGQWETFVSHIQYLHVHSEKQRDTEKERFTQKETWHTNTIHSPARLNSTGLKQISVRLEENLHHSIISQSHVRTLCGRGRFCWSFLRWTRGSYSPSISSCWRSDRGWVESDLTQMNYIRLPTRIDLRRGITARIITHYKHTAPNIWNNRLQDKYYHYKRTSWRKRVCTAALQICCCVKAVKRSCEWNAAEPLHCCHNTHICVRINTWYCLYSLKAAVKVKREKTTRPHTGQSDLPCKTGSSGPSHQSKQHSCSPPSRRWCSREEQPIKLQPVLNTLARVMNPCWKKSCRTVVRGLDGRRFSVAQGQCEKHSGQLQNWHSAKGNHSHIYSFKSFQFQCSSDCKDKNSIQHSYAVWQVLCALRQSGSKTQQKHEPRYSHLQPAGY